VRGDGVYLAYGYRNNCIFVLPDLEMVVVVVAGLSGDLSWVLLNDFIIPAAQSSEPLT
jgi:hypothetical protein